MPRPMHADRIRMELPILYSRELQIFFLIINMHFRRSPKIGFIIANSVYPDEMPHDAAFHLGLHFLPKYLLNENN